MLPKSFPLLLTAVLAASGYAHAEQLESANFNAKDALLNQGFDEAIIPTPPEPNARPAGWGCSAACGFLQLAFGEDRVLTSEEPKYENFTSSYWSALQGALNPECIFKPSYAGAVSSAVLISRLTQCPFAAKSGGHAAFPGASSIEGGITISFEDMNKVEVSADKKTAVVEPGNTWGEVYEKLAVYESVVVGGRVYNIGVGGLTLGGGISFFSGLYGWACDNVAKYTVVTASGIIVEATPTQHEDLYWALRGGGNNFGLVVSFELNLYPLPGNLLWGGTRIYTEDSFPAVLDAFTKVVVEAPEDSNAGQWIAWTQASGMPIASAEFWYSEPVANASIFSGYDGLPTLSDTTAIRPLAEYSGTNQGSNPNGFREIYQGLTTKVDVELLGVAKDIFYEELPSVADVKGSMPVMIHQSISVPIMESMQKNGGNALGLNPSDGPLYLIHIAFWWESEDDDATVYKFVSRVLERLTSEAERRLLQSKYIYMNYASMFQDVISGYGDENKERLRTVAALYDPQQVFQKLQPGYFKFDATPIEALGRSSD